MRYALIALFAFGCAEEEPAPPRDLTYDEFFDRLGDAYCEAWRECTFSTRECEDELVQRDCRPGDGSAFRDCLADLSSGGCYSTGRPEWPQSCEDACL